MTTHVIRQVEPSTPDGQHIPRRGVGLGLGALTALVVGSMIGSGIFALPSQMAASAAPGAVAHRVGDHGGRHADARLRLPDPGEPQARRRRRRLRLRQGRVRQLRRLHVRLGILGQRVGRQRRLPGAVGLDAGVLVPVVRGWQHLPCDPGRLGRAVGRPAPDPARRAQRRVGQHPGHHRQGGPDRHVHRHRGGGLQGGSVHRRRVGALHSEAARSAAPWTRSRT